MENTLVDLLEGGVGVGVGFTKGVSPGTPKEW